jgi:hypothetical protein
VNGILFLDLSKHLGWAFGRSAEAVPLWGVRELPDEGGYGYQFNACMNTLEDLLDEHRPARVGIEDIISQRHNSTYTARLTAGLHAVADLVCYQNDIQPERVSADRIRSAVIGRCRLTALERAIRPKLTVKDVIVEPWCRAHGWGEITSHDARDAAVGLAYLIGIRSGKPNAKAK